MESAKSAKNNNFCHDCQKEIELEGDDIKNGVLLVYDDNGEKINILKCDKCFAENKALNNFRKCEVYSRVVGYIRPVEQWHKGKKQEFGERQEYIMPESNSFCC